MENSNEMPEWAEKLQEQLDRMAERVETMQKQQDASPEKKTDTKKILTDADIKAWATANTNTQNTQQP